MTAESARRPRSSPRLFETGDLPPIVRDPSQPTHRKPFNPFRFGIKTVAFIIVFYVFVLPAIPGFRKAANELLDVRPQYLLAGVALQVAAWMAYSELTRSALGDAARQVSRMRIFRIQMSTKALTNIVPAGSAAGSALGYRLLTLSGIRGPDAGFAMATAGLGSAVVLNIIFWLSLTISIPLKGFNPVYASAALAGVIVMLVAAGLVIGMVHGQGRAERIIRWIASKLRFDADKATGALRQVGTRVEELFDDRDLLKRVVMWSVANWLLDAASLWVFLLAFGKVLDPIALMVAFGLANVMAAIPITPGGLGIVEGIYIPTLVGFNTPRSVAVVGVASYRIAQNFLPIFVGGVFYASLRIGPWSITRRERLARLRTLAHQGEQDGETRIDFLMRSWPKRVVIEPMREVDVEAAELEEAARSAAITALEARESRDTDRDPPL